MTLQPLPAVGREMGRRNNLESRAELNSGYLESSSPAFFRDFRTSRKSLKSAGKSPIAETWTMRLADLSKVAAVHRTAPMPSSASNTFRTHCWIEDPDRHQEVRDDSRFFLARGTRYSFHEICNEKPLRLYTCFLPPATMNASSRPPFIPEN